MIDLQMPFLKLKHHISCFALSHDILTPVGNSLFIRIILVECLKSICLIVWMRKWRLRILNALLKISKQVFLMAWVYQYSGLNTDPAWFFLHLNDTLCEDFYYLIQFLVIELVFFFFFRNLNILSKLFIGIKFIVLPFNSLNVCMIGSDVPVFIYKFVSSYLFYKKMKHLKMIQKYYF